MRIAFLVVLALGLPSALPGQTASGPERLEVLFLGDDRGHKPIERYRVLKQVLGPRGVNLTYAEELGDISRERLDLHDALIVYANHEADKVPEAIAPWVRDGGGLVALHCACGNFHPSEEWFDLVGGRFASHEGHVFSPRTVDPDHPITRGLPKLEAWDETYVHKDLTDDRHVLQVRDPINAGESEPEPWTWTRDEGKGRVFYTASGHDMRVWKEPAYQQLVYNGILWAVGEERAKAFQALKLPALETEVPKLKDRAHPDLPMMELQKPLPPQDSAAHTQVPAGTRLSLFASEPMVVNPIAIDWDERGRAWVVESFGYPNDVPKEPGKGMDKIKVLEDTNGDGKADKVTVFADGLRHCTTTVFVRGGVLATDGPDIVFLRDENGDGKADTRKVLASGLKIWDTHASTSHFHYGLDNWIYAVVGYSGVDMELHGTKHEFGQSVFRFRPDLSKLEHLQRTTNNTWGIGITEEGDIVGSTANNNPSWMLSIPAAAYAGSGIEQQPAPRIDASTEIYPNTLDITQVDQIDRFTAAAGHDLYTDDVLAGTFGPGHTFICEPTGHLVALGEMTPHESLARTHLRGNNLFASADAWSAPVAARTGPDGAVWIADWYNPIVQHNVVFRFWNPARGYDHPHSPYHTGDKGPGAGNAYVTPLRDREHGRIWRVTPADGSVRKTTALDPAKPATLLKGLLSPSRHIRLHAQRLLVERGNADVIPHLRQLIQENASPEGSAKPLAAVHAIWILEGLGIAPGSPAEELLVSTLKSGRDPLVRRHAMLALGPEHPAVVAELPTLIEKTTGPRERLIVLSVAAQSLANDLVAKALWNAVRDAGDLDETQREAARLALRRQGATLLAAVLPDMEGDLGGLGGEELTEIAKRVAGSPNRAALAALIDRIPANLKGRFETILSEGGGTAPAEKPLPEHLVHGRDAYMKACIECHQADGSGVEKTFPPLAGSEWVKGNPRTLLRILLGGVAGPIEVKGVAYNSVMPGHSHVDDEEIAAIASYVRHAFGGLNEKPFPAEEVAKIRPEIEARKYVPWSVEDLKQAERK